MIGLIFVFLYCITGDRYHLSRRTQCEQQPNEGGSLVKPLDYSGIFAEATRPYSSTGIPLSPPMCLLQARCLALTSLYMRRILLEF